MNILQIPTANRFPGRNGYKPRYLIYHGTAGFKTAEDVGYYFQTADVSSNYVIGKDGTIVCCVNDEDGAWANGVLDAGHDPWWSNDLNPNLITISIEHVKNHQDANGRYDNQDELTPEQQVASFALTNMLCKKWNIPKRKADANGGITGHFSIAPINRKECPGPYPWGELFSGGSMIPQGWSDDSKTLTAPNGVPVILGFRDYVITHAWDALNWPLAPEAGIAQLELSNPSLGGGTQQIFRWKMLGWTKERGVFEEWLGAELYVVRQVLQSLKTPPADIVAFLTTLLGASEQLSGQIEAILKQLQPAP